MVGVDYRSGGLTVFDGHGERVGGEGGVGPRVDGPAHDAAAEDIQHDRAVDLAFPRGVLGDVGDPQLIGLVTGELAVHQVTGGRTVGDLAIAGPARQAGQAVAAHHQLNGAARHDDAPSVRQLGVDASGAVGATGGVMDLADDLQQHPMAHRPRRRRAPPPGVVARHRDAQDPAANLHRVAVSYDGGGDFESPFGSVWALSNSFARFVTASSVSSSRIRRRAATNSTDSAVVTPGFSPRSTRSCLRQL